MNLSDELCSPRAGGADALTMESADGEISRSLAKRRFICPPEAFDGRTVS
jgi:hypothetical protein